MPEAYQGIRSMILARKNLNQGTTEIFKSPCGGIVLLSVATIHPTPPIRAIIEQVREREVLAGMEAHFYETIFSPSYLDSLMWIPAPEDGDRFNDFLKEFYCTPTHAVMISSCPKAWSNEFILSVRLEVLNGCI